MSLTEIQPRRTAHTLFLDFVGYSRLSADSQAAVQVTLQSLVTNLPAFQAARNENQLMVRKTGDGMAVVFFQNIEFPLAAAVALDEVIKHQATSLREQVGANFRLRMGVHSGPVVIVDEDGDGIMDVAGEGINMAQRVMDCGDQGHILVSAAVATAVTGLESWQSLLHDMGIVRVKHDELVHLYNLHGVRPDGTMIGFEALPRKVHEARERARDLAEQEASREKTEQRTTITHYALRATLLLAAFVGVIAILLALWRNSTIDSGDIHHVADVIRKNRLAQENKNKPPKTVTLATPTPSEPENSTPGELVHATVPKVVGMLRPDAEKALASVGLKLALSERTPEVENAAVPVGSIVNQSPPPGEQSVRNGVVFVSLAAGGAGAATPAPEGEHSTFTGVLVDARNFPQLASSTSAGLFGPNDVPLYNAAGITSDEVQAIQLAGTNPLRLSALTAGPNGAALSADDVTRLRALPESVRAKTVILRSE